MANPPKTYTIPPAPPKKGRTQNSFDKFISAHKSLQPYKTVIQQYAGEYGVPALWVAAVIQFESGGDPLAGTGKNGKPVNPTGNGLAQINPKTWYGKTFPPTGEQINQAWAEKPGNAVNFAAWYLSTGISTYGTLQGVYENVYNHGYKGPGPESLLKSYPDQGINSIKGTPQQGAQGSAARGQARLTNQADQNLKTQQALDPVYLAYTGKRASVAEVQAFIKNPISTYQLEMQLSNPKANPLLYKSPVWRTNSGRYEQYYRDVFGPNAKVPQNVIRYGIVNSLDETAFKADLSHDKIQGQQQYAKSEQFQQLYAQYNAAYTQVYGKPDNNGKASITMAINGGWSADQFNNWLRNQPEYKNSNEYKVRSINLAKSMGLLTEGEAQTVISKSVTQEPYTGVAFQQPHPAVVSTVNTKPKSTPPQPAPPPQVPQLTSENGQGGGRRG